MTSERMTDEHIAVIKRLLPWLRERSVVLWNHDEVVAALDDLLREVERARAREAAIRKVVKAQDDLITCYRTGRTPPEKVLEILHQHREQEAAAKAKEKAGRVLDGRTHDDLPWLVTRSRGDHE